MKKQETFVESLTKILQKQNAIKQEDAQSLKKIFYDRSDLTFDEFLLEEGLISRSQLLNALSELYQVPAFDATGYFFEYHTLHEFPKDVMLRYLFIPVKLDENHNLFEPDEDILPVIANNPNDPDLLEEIGKYVSYDITFMVGLARDISDAVKEFYDRSPTELHTDDDVNELVEETEEIDELLHPHTRKDEE
ncbi:hypothetical protein HYX58_03780 [Candidatus Dependentiae bacterium]|nr:hypothetical protein [Candidatus Dependentiae bacterium]